MNKMKRTSLLALAAAAVLVAAPQSVYAQGGRRTTATQQQQQEQKQTATETRNTNTTNTGTVNTDTRRSTTSTQQPQTTTTTRQTTPTTGTTTTTNRRQDATNAQKPAQQPSSQPSQQPQKPSGNQPTQQPGQQQPQKPSQQPGVRPGGSSTHQNGNGNAVRPGSQHGNQPGQKPQPKPSSGKDIKPGYQPGAITQKPPKHPDYYKPGKPYDPKPYYSMGYHMFGTRVNKLPVGYVSRVYKNVNYYYYNGVFYKSNNLSGYIICRPPVGFAFNAYNSAPLLPYVLIDPYRDPSVRIAEAISLSRLYARMYPGYRMLDETYYMNNVIRQQITQYLGMDGIYYSVTNGTYTIVDPPIGALTDRLPYDYEEIWLGGDLFYLVDNILYGVVAPEGVPYFEIFCIL